VIELHALSRVLLPSTHGLPSCQLPDKLRMLLCVCCQLLTRMDVDLLSAEMRNNFLPPSPRRSTHTRWLAGMIRLAQQTKCRQQLLSQLKLKSCALLF
jgi:hypothetical protein